MLRSVAALAAGLLFMLATVAVGRIVGTAALVPAGGAMGGSLLLDFGLSAVATAIGGFLGGWLTARMAPARPFGHAVGLALAVAALAMASASGAPSQAGLPPPPLWYGVATTLIGIVTVLAGGGLRSAAAEPV